MTSKRERGQWLQVGGLLVAVISIAITVYFSIRSERTKEVTITYLAKRPLVSTESGRASAGLEVRLGDARLAAPWLLSARIDNSGNQPIEERDIEVPSTLSFSRGRIVSAEVAQRSQPNIFAGLSFVDSVLTLNHKLLNPGDWISFDVLFDGEPSIPSLSFRISGVNQPKSRTLSNDQARAHPTIIALPLPVVYLLLAIGSLVGLASAIGGLAVIARVVRDAVRSSRQSGKGTEYIASASDVGLVPPTTQAARVVFTFIENGFEVAWIDQPDRLRSVIANNVPRAVLQGIRLDANQATVLLISELKEGLRNSLAHMLTFGPGKGDHKIGDELLKTAVDSVSTQELVVLANQLARSHASSKPSFDSEALIGALVLLVIGICLVLVLGGTWLTVAG